MVFFVMLVYTLIMLSTYPKGTGKEEIVEVFITDKKTGLSDRLDFTAGEHFSLMRFIKAMFEQRIKERGEEEDNAFNEHKYKITEI